jgi:peptide/nickel transport system substrate-binding protein
MSSTRKIASAVLAGALALGLAACGSSSGVSGGSGITVAKGIQTPQTEAQSGGRRGGTLTVLNQTDFEQIDPGLAYYNIDYEVVYATQRPLFSYKPNTFATPSPDMASAPAQISDGGKTITVHIRDGVHFSPPVNREVTSADVAYAIERGGNQTVDNPYFEAYFCSRAG